MRRGFLGSPRAGKLLKPSCNGLVVSVPDIVKETPSMSMKRGFLNTSKARKRLEESLPSDSPLEAVAPSMSPMAFDVGPGTFGISPEFPPMFIVTLPPGNSPNSKLQMGSSTECYISEAAKDVILNTPGFPRAPLIPTGGKPYRVAQTTDGKGLGMFATRILSAGDLILDERAIIIHPHNFRVDSDQTDFLTGRTDFPSMNDHTKILETLVKRLPAGEQKAFYALANCHEHDRSGPILGRIYTNGTRCFKDVTGIPEGYTALCRDYSRINHSCSPNSTYLFHTESLSLRLYAVRDIPCGSEITITYSETLEPAAERRSALEYWDIDCKCRACTDPIVSDERRARFMTPLVLQHPIRSCRPGLPRDAWLTPARKLMDEIEEEGLETTGIYADTLYQLLVGYSYLADVERALFFAKKWAGVQKATVPQELDDKFWIFFLSPVGIQTMECWKSIESVEKMISVANLAYIEKLGLD